MLVRLEAHYHPTYMLVTGYEPDVFRIYAFGYAFHVPSCSATTYQYGSSKKDVYLLSIMILHHANFFQALAFAGCHFNKIVFPSLGGDKNVNVPLERHELAWMLPTVSHLDPHTA